MEWWFYHEYVVVLQHETYVPLPDQYTLYVTYARCVGLELVLFLDSLEVAKGARIYS